MANTPKYKRETIRIDLSFEERKKLNRIKRCGFALLVVDSVVFGTVERYLYRIINQVKEADLYKREVKRSINVMLDSIKWKRKIAKADSLVALINDLTRWLPESRSRFDDQMGAPEDVLNGKFYREHGEEIEGLIGSLREEIAKMGVQYTEILCDLSIIYVLCSAAQKTHQANVDAMDQFFKIEDLKGDTGRYISLMVEKFIAYSKTHCQRINNLATHASNVVKAIELGGGKEKVIEEWTERASYAEGVIYGILSGDKIERLIDNAMSDTLMRYVEFYIACLRIDFDIPGKFDGSYRTSLANVIGNEHVDELLAEVCQIPPMTSDEDMLEFASRLPDSKEGSQLFRLRRLMFEKFDVSKYI